MLERSDPSFQVGERKKSETTDFVLMENYRLAQTETYKLNTSPLPEAECSRVF